MIKLFYWPTPNGHKVTMFLEEAKLDYEIVPINIGRGEQFETSFLKIAPNNRMPAIIDDEPLDGGDPISVFESGAILQYLAEKTDEFIPNDLRKKVQVMEWLFWQMGGLGPMAGQNHHFVSYAPDPIPYAIERYVNETARLYAVLDKQLCERDYIADDYSIADMACYPWVVLHERQRQNLEDFPGIKKWYRRIRSKESVVRAYAKGKDISRGPVVDEESKKILFGQGAHTIKEKD
ncbi:glutathione S-transferase N-terminal domain-containing protein [Burkholderiales bacterium]|nr:glutathione S-transferase N-terminal domain-containing protein [Burkholderiales bacterium]